MSDISVQYRQARLLPADVCTSNYRKQGRNKNAVRISVGCPSNFDGPAVEEVIPPDYLVRGWQDGSVTKGEYLRVYRRQLEDMPLEKVMKKLLGKVALCFCSEHVFCHRFILADFLREHGYTVVEI